MTEETNNARKLKVSCPGCGQKLDVSGIAAFSEIHCPKCQCELKVPRRFAHFLLEDPIEHGPIASVYRALDLKLDRQVAVKIFDAEIGKTPETLEIFREITRKYAALNHPNIIPIYSSGEHEEFPYLTMEFMDCMGVRHKVGDKGPLPVSEVLRIAELAARGLDAARNEEVEHGDLHPRNILINKDGEVKVSDFQMQRLTGTAPEAAGAGANACRTDPRYASPELLENGTQDYLGDIYSLGLILVFMLKGAHPINAEQPVDERKIDWSTIAQPVPDTVKVLVDSMTARFPDKRPQAYRKVISTIEKLRTSQKLASKFGNKTAGIGKKTAPSSAKKGQRNGPKKGEFLKKKLQKSRRRALVRKALALLILIGLGFGAWTLFKASKERPDWYVNHVDPFLLKLRAAFGGGVADAPPPTSTTSPAKTQADSPHTKAEPQPPPEAEAPDSHDNTKEPQSHTDENQGGNETFQPSPTTFTPTSTDNENAVAETDANSKPAPSLNDRPRPADLDFHAVAEELRAYVNKQPEELQEIEKDRIRKLSSIRSYLQSVMHYIPFESEDGYIELASGRRIRGSIPFCNDRGLTIRLDRRQAKLRTVEWKDVDIKQYQELLEFYAKKRLTASGGPNGLEIKITPRKDAANDYLLAALLSEWYGRPDDAAGYAKQAVHYDPELNLTVKRFFHYLID